MHAEAIVTRFVEQAWAAIHGTRRRVLAAMVWAAMCGTVVSLSRLARGMVGAGRTAKAALKRLDRLVGHARIERQVDVLAQAILLRLARWMDPWVIAVDWSAVTPGRTFVALRAAVVWSGMGRGLQVCQRVYPAKLQGNGKAERSFLRDLSRMILRGTRVIVISEAGLPTPWFRAVTRPGRGWIGRVRRGNQVRRGDGLWRDARGFGQRATAQAVRMSDCELTCKQRLACDLVMARRAPAGRKTYRRPGHGSLPKAAGEARRSAREPWVLAHSIDLRDRRPDEIVALYARRMQIEENFRDTKSLAFGMGTEIGRSRSALRLRALLLIATLAAYLLWHLGQLAEAEGMAKRFKVTSRTTRELSIVALAMLLCTERIIRFTPQAVAELHDKLNWGGEKRGERQPPQQPARPVRVHVRRQPSARAFDSDLDRRANRSVDHDRHPCTRTCRRRLTQSPAPIAHARQRNPVSQAPIAPAQSPGLERLDPLAPHRRPRHRSALAKTGKLPAANRRLNGGVAGCLRGSGSTSSLADAIIARL